MTLTDFSAPEPQPIPLNVFRDLVHYFKYASSAYSLLCPRPNGNTLVMPFSNVLTDIQGFVARDNTRKEIIVAFRGSASVADFLLDTQILLVPFLSPGVSAPAGTRVHSGFLFAWSSVAFQVLAIVAQQLHAHKGFSVVTTGHSLGGSLSILAAITLQQNHPDCEIRSYSYRAPRTGNDIFAAFVNSRLGPNAYRVVHSNDGVPTIIPRSIGYHHHGIEYWQKADPASEETTLQCAAGGEDPLCSVSIPSGGINVAHTNYFGILVSTPFCF